MERKQRYKMYKSGKNWVIAPLVFFGIALGFQAGVHNVFADETIQKPQVVNLNSPVGDQKENSTSTDSQEDTASDKDPIQTNGEEKVANQSQSEKTVTTDAGSNQKKASFEENDGQADDQQQLKGKDQLNDETINNNDQNNRTQSDNVNDKQQNNDQAAVDSQKDSNEALRNDLNKQQPSTRNLVLKNDQPKQVKENGFWYLRDKNGHNLIGFQNIQDQNKRVYYNNRGQMQYGEQKISNNWYLFDNVTGAMQTGFKYLSKGNKTVYYNEQGKMQKGQAKVADNWYLFDNITGARQTGFKRIAQQNKTVYYNNVGQMQYGQQKIQNSWYLFDNVTGAMQTGFQRIPEQAKTVYYDQQGKMSHGQRKINGAWYLFDQNTGAVKVGLQKIADQNKTVYYDKKTAQMLKGQQHVDNRWYLFDKVTGAMQTGLRAIPEQKKLVYYDPKNGQMQYGTILMDGQNGTKSIFYFDKTTGALTAIGDQTWYDEAQNDMPFSFDESSMSTVNGYLSWTGWYRPKGYHQNGQKWVQTGASDWRPYMLYIWPSNDIQAKYIQYFVGHGYTDQSLGLTAKNVNKLNGSTNSQLLNDYSRKLRDAIEKEIFENNYSTSKLASTMDGFVAFVPEFNGLSELPVEKQPGYKPDNSGTVDNDQLLFVNSGNGNQKQGNTTNADSQFRNLNHTIWNQYGTEKDGNKFGPELLVGNDIDNSNPVVQAENINWEYFLLKYGEIMGYGSDANFDGFRNDAADNIDADVLDQQAQLLNDMFDLKGSEANANGHLVYNEGYHSGAASMLGNKNNQQLYMDSQEFYTLLNTLGKAHGKRNKLTDLITNSVVDRHNDNTDSSAQPNWSFVTNHDQRKNVINQIIIDSHPGVTDIMGDSYKAEYAVQAWEKYYNDELQTNKQYAIYNVLAQYAILLSNKDTVPQIYYGDMFDETKPYMESKSIYYDGIVAMLKARQKYVAGGQSYQSYGDDLIASVRYGKGNASAQAKGSDPLGRTTGMAVIVSNNPTMQQRTITVAMGKAHANQQYMNLINTTASSSNVGGVSYNSDSILTTDSDGNLVLTIKGYANPLVNGYLGVWVPVGAAEDQVATTADSTAKKSSGKIYESNAALDSHVIYEDFSLYQPEFADINKSAYVVLADHAQDFADMGVTDFWMAPPYTSFSMSRYNEGYSINDRYTLGTDEAPTKYGTGAQLADALKAIHAAGMKAQVDMVMNQMIGFPTQEAVTVSRTDNYGNTFSVDGKTFANEVYLPYTIGGGQGQSTYGGKFLDELKQKYPDLFTTKAGSTGVAPDSSTHITQWSAKYENGTSTQNIGIGRVMKEKDGNYDYVESGNNHLLHTQLPSDFTSEEKWLSNNSQSTGWIHVKGQTYYYDKGTVVLGEQKINGHWYMFDSQTGVMDTGFTNISKAKKTVYYDIDGKMLYGEQKINGHWYYFDQITGSRATGFKKLSGKTVYYNANGQMLYGRQVINGHVYNFDRVTGALK